MAIAYDSTAAVVAITSTSVTVPLVNTAGDFIVACGHDRDTSGTAITGVTFPDSVDSATALVAGPTSQTPTDRYTNIYYWDNAALPWTGASRNVVVSASASVPLRWSAYSYSGVNYSDPLSGTSDTSIGSAVATVDTDITTADDNAWMFMFIKDNSGGKTVTSGDGDTIRMTADAGGHSVADTGGAISPAGANNMTLNWTGNTDVSALAIAFKPSGGAVARKNKLTMLGVG